MKPNQNKNHDKKHLFKASEYCLGCKQKKSCGVLDRKKEYCCSCYRKVLEELEWEQLLTISAQKLLNGYRKRKIVCWCLESEKLRVKYLKSSGSGWTSCERCERVINGAGHHGVIKNRNDPGFWGLEVEERVLCLGCLKKFREKMPKRKKYLLEEYLKRGYV